MRQVRWRGRRSLALTRIAQTSAPRKRPPVTDAADRIQDGLKIYKTFIVPLSKKRKAPHPEGLGFVQRINEEKKPLLFVRLVLWHFVKLRVSTNITQRKSLKRYAKISHDSRRLSNIYF